MCTAPPPEPDFAVVAVAGELAGERRTAETVGRREDEAADLSDTVGSHRRRGRGQGGATVKKGADSGEFWHCKSARIAKYQRNTYPKIFGGP